MGFDLGVRLVFHALVLLVGLAVSLSLWFAYRDWKGGGR